MLLFGKTPFKEAALNPKPKPVCLEFCRYPWQSLEAQLLVERLAMPWLGGDSSCYQGMLSQICQQHCTNIIHRPSLGFWFLFRDLCVCGSVSERGCWASVMGV